jgi:hypothetical protein
MQQNQLNIQLLNLKFQYPLEIVTVSSLLHFMLVGSKYKVIKIKVQ